MKSRLVLGTALLSLLVFVVPASGQMDRNQAIEHCRKTVGKPIVTACMRKGGSKEACRESARPQVRACVSGKGMNTGCTAYKKLSGEPCL